MYNNWCTFKGKCTVNNDIDLFLIIYSFIDFMYCISFFKLTVIQGSRNDSSEGTSEEMKDDMLSC